jgi:hypothetical protein
MSHPLGNKRQTFSWGCSLHSADVRCNRCPALPGYILFAERLSGPTNVFMGADTCGDVSASTGRYGIRSEEGIYVSVDPLNRSKSKFAISTSTISRPSTRSTARTPPS